MFNYNERFTLKHKVNNRGFSLPELLIATTILLSLVGIILNYMTVSWRAHDYTNAQAYLKSQAQSGLIRISKSINQAKLIMSNNAEGLAYLNKLDLSNAPPAIPSSTLPTLRDSGSLSPEKVCTDYPDNYFRSNAVGNSLLFTQLIGSFTDFPAGTNYKVDLYEFSYFYITDNSHLPNSDIYFFTFDHTTLPAQTLIGWRSIRFASFDQVQALLAAAPNEPARTAIKSSLIGAGINYTWERSENNLNLAFRDLNSGTGSSLNAMGGGFLIPEARTYNALLLTNSSEGYYSIAYNKEDTSHTGSTFIPIRMNVPHFYDDTPTPCPANAREVIPASGTTPLTSTGNFPRGFEVMVAGPGSGRAVLLRASLIGKTQRNLIEHAHMLTAYARDL